MATARRDPRGRSQGSSSKRVRQVGRAIRSQLPTGVRELGLDEMRQALLFTGGVAVLGLAVSTWCAGRDVKRAHEEMRVLRASIHEGMTPKQIEGAFEKLQPKHLRYAGAHQSIVTIVQTSSESGLKEWVLWVSLRQGGAAAIRIRTADSHEERPPDAPDDVIWQEEDQGTPFSRRVSGSD